MCIVYTYALKYMLYVLVFEQNNEYQWHLQPTAEQERGQHSSRRLCALPFHAPPRPLARLQETGAVRADISAFLL